MKKITTLVLLLVCVFCLLGCGFQHPSEQKEYNNVQYFFSGKVLEAQEEYLKLEVFYIGNTNLSEGSVVEVSTDVVAAADCPEFALGEHARVVMARNTENAPAECLQALAIFKEDAESDILILEDLTPTPTLAPGQDQALPTTMIDGEIYFMNGMYSTAKQSEITRIKELIEQAEYLGETSLISSKEYPTKELESNCFTEGSKVYRHQMGEKVNFIIVPPNELSYYYVSGWHKYRWFEEKLIDAGEQNYNKTGMPTPTPAVTL